MPAANNIDLKHVLTKLQENLAYEAREVIRLVTMHSSRAEAERQGILDYIAGVERRNVPTACIENGVLKSYWGDGWDLARKLDWRDNVRVVTAPPGYVLRDKNSSWHTGDKWFHREKAEWRPCQPGIPELDLPSTVIVRPECPTQAGLTKGTVLAVPPDGWRLVHRDEPWREGDRWWDMAASCWSQLVWHPETANLHIPATTQRIRVIYHTGFLPPIPAGFCRVCDGTIRNDDRLFNFVTQDWERVLDDHHFAEPPALLIRKVKVVRPAFDPKTEDVFIVDHVGGKWRVWEVEMRPSQTQAPPVQEMWVKISPAGKPVSDAKWSDAVFYHRMAPMVIVEE